MTPRSPRIDPVTWDGVEIMIAQHVESRVLPVLEKERVNRDAQHLQNQVEQQNLRSAIDKMKGAWVFAAVLIPFLTALLIWGLSALLNQGKNHSLLPSQQSMEYSAHNSVQSAEK